MGEEKEIFEFAKGRVQSLPVATNYSPRDASGRTPLHWAALEGGDESIIETLLDKGADAAAVDAAGDSPLHLAARAGLPMAAYQVCCAAPATALAVNDKALTPVDLAAAGERGEVLNAMLLACAGAGGGEPAIAAAALVTMRIVLERGAVCDTWAPNGSSALMLAASSAATDAAPVELLLQNGASLELQDALGRTATMFAAGNGATAGLRVLLDAGASISVRDRRGKNVLDYAVPGSEARALLEERLAEMESRASRLQEELLAELLDEESSKTSKTSATGKFAKRKKGKTAKKAARQQQQKQAAAVEPEQEAADDEVATAKQANDEAAAMAQPVANSGSEAGQRTPVVGQADAKAEAVGVAIEEQEEGHNAEAAAPLEAAAGAVAAEAAAADAAQDSSPPSPGGWQVVGSKASKQRERERSSSRPPALRGTDTASSGGGTRMQRSMSGSSLASSSSWESHDTDHSRNSGSERSVLPPVAGRSSSSAVSTQPRVITVPRHAGALTKAVHAAVTQQQPSTTPVDEAQPLTVAAAVAPTLFPTPAAGTSLQDMATTAAAPVVLAAAAAPVTSAAAPAAASVAVELAALRAEVGRLQQQLAAAAEAHRRELAAVLEEARLEQALAVQAAVQAERNQNIINMAAFLQNHGATLLSVLPSLTGASPPGSSSIATAISDVPPLQGAFAAALGFPEAAGLRAKPAPCSTVLASGLDSLLDRAAPLSSSPFSLDELSHLRDEFGRAPFLVPAAPTADEAVAVLPSLL